MFDPTDAKRCLAFLEAIAADPIALAKVDLPVRKGILTAAGRLSRPSRDEHRARRKANRKEKVSKVQDADDALLHSTGIRTARRMPAFITPKNFLPAPEAPPIGDLHEARKCYVCKAEFQQLHHFYDQMCPPCAEFNWRKRYQTADLRGRTALVTGARLKIGYQAAIMLLRAGARVVVVTRFPHDAARRYADEADFAEWSNRLSIHGLDLRHTPSVELFAQHLLQVEERLDFILHNACQTVRRPVAFYAHLDAPESTPFAALPAAQQAILADYEKLRCSPRHQHLASGLVAPAQLAQSAVTPEDRMLSNRVDIFPAGMLDQDQQQVDLRTINSWRLKLADVSTVELLEVQLVNSIAPFVLTARLKPLMLRHPSRDKHLVNVSAMEGQFNRGHKTDKHPHTNMAKAALNMMTRTSAQDFVADGIHMNSVDTGWVTDEDPVTIAERKVEEHGFHPPLDIVDGAARICDPIFTGINTQEHIWGQFLKDYVSVPW